MVLTLSVIFFTVNQFPYYLSKQKLQLVEKSPPPQWNFCISFSFLIRLYYLIDDHSEHSIYDWNHNIEHRVIIIILFLLSYVVDGSR
jgi:hypothetical protein